MISNDIVHICWERGTSSNKQIMILLAITDHDGRRYPTSRLHVLSAAGVLKGSEGLVMYICNFEADSFFFEYEISLIFACLALDNMFQHLLLRLRGINCVCVAMTWNTRCRASFSGWGRVRTSTKLIEDRLETWSTTEVGSLLYPSEKVQVLCWYVTPGI
jgi:hypothetical protein